MLCDQQAEHTTLYITLHGQKMYSYGENFIHDGCILEILNGEA